MQLEIKLADPDYCDGCEYLSEHGLFHNYCKHYDKMNKTKMYDSKIDLFFLRVIRSDICKKENGK